MIVEAVDVLGGLRAALEAPPEERARAFVELVVEPLRPAWEPMLGYAPAGQEGVGDPALAAARMLGLYGPERSPEEGLEAIARLERAGTWDACQRTLRQAVAVLRPEAHGVELERVVLAVALADPTTPDFLDRNYGYTGWGGRPGHVVVLVWPIDFNVPRLPAVVAHEFHHNVRLSFEPWTPAVTVGQYVVLEGLAEAFAAELCGEDTVGPWATALAGAELERARRRIGEALDVAGFDKIRGYIFGDWAAAAMGYEPRGLPDFAGYAVGYRLVQAYLQRTGRTAAEATYVPWREIVAESGYW